MLTDYKAILGELAHKLPKIGERPVRSVRKQEEPCKNKMLMTSLSLSPLNSPSERPVRTEENQTHLTPPRRFAERPADGCKPKENQGFQEKLTCLTALTLENKDIVNYKKFFEQKKAFHHLETGLPEKEAEWKAANDTVFQFMHNTGTFNESLEVRSFIESLYHMYSSLKE
jgi:hypothetical protein